MSSSRSPRLLWAHELGLDVDRILCQAARAVCPSCLRSIIKLIQCNVSLEAVNEFVVWPKATARPVPPEVHVRRRLSKRPRSS